jgi:hypothetical protein
MKRESEVRQNLHTSIIYLDIGDVEVLVNKLLVERGEATGDCG